MIAKLVIYLQYPFVRYALIVCLLAALCSALLGVTLVLRNYSLIGDGLSHVAFGAMSVAAIMNLTNRMNLVLPVTITCAVLLLRKKENAKLKGDAPIAIMSVTSLALGYLLVNVFSPTANTSGDVCSVLFGSTSILTLTIWEVRASIVLSVLVVTAFVICYNRIFAVTFDEDFARASGVKADLYNLIVAVITAVVIVLAMNLAGSLLISALIIFPAVSAMQICRSFLKVTVFSAILAVICSLSGIVTAILAGTPVGSTIVAVQALAFVICCAVKKGYGGGGI